MAMVLAKTDLAVASRYAELVPDAALRERDLRAHRRGARTHACARCWRSPGSRGLLADNPTLARSIRNRFPYLDPLNHLQVELLRRYRAGRDRRADAAGDPPDDQRGGGRDCATAGEGGPRRGPQAPSAPPGPHRIMQMRIVLIRIDTRDRRTAESAPFQPDPEGTAMPSPPPEPLASPHRPAPRRAGRAASPSPRRAAPPRSRSSISIRPATTRPTRRCTPTSPRPPASGSTGIEAGDEQLLERIRSEGAQSPADVLLIVDAARLVVARSSRACSSR